MRTSRKLSGDQRKASIVQAVRHLFANKGFKGTTTRAMAAAAGVSEALLYRHFPTKQALFAAIRESFLCERNLAWLDHLARQRPSTAVLVQLIHSMVVAVVNDAADSGEGSIPLRLIIRSLAEDGEFARLMFQHMASVWSSLVQECLVAAVAAGDAADGPVPRDLGSWFSFHLAAMVAVQFLPPGPAVAYGPLGPGLVEKVTWFALRGLGVRDEAIRSQWPQQPPALPAPSAARE
jgi:AcrR family transcriptional regulator